MAHLDKIFAPWDGNAEAMASDIGELGVTVRQWRNRGRIRDIYWRRIIAAADAKGHELTPDDFLPEPQLDHAAPDTIVALPVSPDKAGKNIAQMTAHG